tara:strand:- start:2269 stop:2706 length:438 start_codon:yes stop_codon:yes gene_type:complete
MVKILIKKLDQNVIIPEYKTKGASGMDLTANIKEPFFIEPGKSDIVPTGISLLIPIGYEVQIRPRSGLAAKKKVSVLNTPGTIDSDYRGEIKVILINFGKEKFKINPKDRIAQMVLCPVVKIEFEEVNELEDTKRGGGGFGSTGI